MVSSPSVLPPSRSGRPKLLLIFGRLIVPSQRHRYPSPPSENARKSSPRYSHVWQTLRRVRYSSTPFAVEVPAITSRSLANALTACSALLLFHGTPSWPRKVNSLSRYFWKRAPLVPGRSGTPFGRVEEPFEANVMLAEMVRLQAKAIDRVDHRLEYGREGGRCFSSSSNGFFRSSSFRSRMR